MTDPEKRYRLAVEALEFAQAEEKKALREYHDARHALIAHRANAYRVPRRPLQAGVGPCEFCGKAMRPVVGEVWLAGEEPRRHVDLKAGLACGQARIEEARDGSL